MDTEEAEFAGEGMSLMSRFMSRHRDSSTGYMVYRTMSLSSPFRAMLPRMRQFVQSARQRHRKKRCRQEKRDYGTRYGLNRIHERQSYINESAMTRKMQMNCN
jgi:hypothetical protein